jgi:hypothetical protein
VTERLDLIYRRLNRPVDHELLLGHVLAEVNAPWFGNADVRDEATTAIVRRCHQILWDQRGREEASVVMSLIQISRTWDRQSKEFRESPAKHLLRWNAALIQSALLDAFA